MFIFPIIDLQAFLQIYMRFMNIRLTKTEYVKANQLQWLLLQDTAISKAHFKLEVALTLIFQKRLCTKSLSITHTYKLLTLNKIDNSRLSKEVM